MKTKKIDVWVNGQRLEDRYLSAKDSVSHVESGVNNALKAKLIVEIPEEKIEITKSEFKKACEETDYEWDRSPRLCRIDFNKELGKKLGFTSDS